MPRERERAIQPGPGGIQIVIGDGRRGEQLQSQRAVDDAQPFEIGATATAQHELGGAIEVAEGLGAVGSENEAAAAQGVGGGDLAGRDEVNESAGLSSLIGVATHEGRG
jgi:hypothetical protein